MNLVSFGKSVIFGDTKMTRGGSKKYGINVLNIDIGIKSLTRTLLMPVAHDWGEEATITIVLKSLVFNIQGYYKYGLS